MLLYRFSRQSIIVSQKHPRTSHMKSKLNWTPEEEAFLREIVETGGFETWTQIAQTMNTRFPNKKCTGKQYRERYVNHTQFGEDKLSVFSWKPQEEDSLFRLYAEHGPKWSIISKYFPQKSQNCLKNKFYGSIRKMLRKLNHIGRKTNSKINKLIKYEAIIKILDAAQVAEGLSPEVKAESEVLKIRILQLSKNWPEEFDNEQAMSLIKAIYRFNLATRCYNAKKWKKKDKEREIISNLIDCPVTQGEEVLQRNEKNMKKTHSAPEMKQKNELGFQRSESLSQIEGEQMIDEFQSLDLDMLDETAKFPIPKQDLQEELSNILKKEYKPNNFNYFQ